MILPLAIGFMILFTSTLAFFVMSMSYETEKRTFHHITMFVTGIAAIAYLIMAFEGGAAELTLTDGKVRTFFWVRYVDWALTTPLLLLDIGLLANAPLAHIAYVIGCDVLMIVGGLVGPLLFAANDPAKWLLFYIGCFWFLPILYAMMVEWKTTLTDKARPVYNVIANGTVVLWCAYPVMWAMCEGTGMLSDETEVILYLVLDMVAKSGLGFILLSSHDAITGVMNKDADRLM
ncbi:hypothetical protein KFE25_004480 [Diacronema lutheri]|uniref:Rhodopsin n=1 Tax=Diacronema lutheri TaxID=2081491 RepID=A0A8J5XG16_DIALT|nr:hypothetical protein KFE25_004480 [Diacronema lutheri]